ncbi:MAG: 1-(5-phosphoribosyl)-5-[(5-phosphoribosylamino)methylideneamino]imidazole-4-carboxamide isomerase [bacterium]
MKIIPAIDLYQGKCVRLYQGRFDRVTVYSVHPADVALEWEAAGAELIHLVDLEGACSGVSENLTQIEKIAGKVKVPLQLGGGIRTEEQIKQLLNIGVSRLVIGTLALEYPGLIRNWAEKYPSHIVVGIDAQNGLVATKGWRDISRTPAIELADRFNRSEISSIVYTDIARDGTLEGPNIKELKNFCRYSHKPVISSGGISSFNDLKRLSDTFPDGRLEGAIVGKALYTGNVDLQKAIRELKTAD